jgi:DNA-binding PadR family transcriptional regulator
VTAQSRKPLPFRGQARYAVMALLAFGDELTGYEIHQRTKYTFRYFFGDIAHSQVYRELTQLEELGWVSSQEISRQAASDVRLVRGYQLTPEGRSQLADWADSDRFDPPTLRFPTTLKVWVGHLGDIHNLRLTLMRERRYIEEMLDMIAIVDRGTREEERWLFPGLANRWSQRVWQATLEATTELLEEVEKIEADAATRSPRKTQRSPSTSQRTVQKKK